MLPASSRRRNSPFLKAALASLFLALLLTTASVAAQTPDDAVATASTPAAVSYPAVKALLKERCFACHGSLKQESGLRLDTVTAMRTGGSAGPAITPGSAATSHLFQRVSSTDAATRMPPEGRPLEPAQLQLLEEWLNHGAQPSAQDLPEADPLAHWAFQPPLKAPLPAAAPTVTAASAHPGSAAIDSFISDKLRSAGITPLPAADKPTLLRRAYLDLIGLPPTPAELSAFLNDPDPAAFASAVDRLLADPRYGERWARHWMDVWRYADWYGRRHVPDVWNSAPQIWRWRDWIVNSLNADHGYDRMLQEMLAADEIRPGDDQAAAATGYLIRNWYALNPNDWMRNIVEHTGKAFLGLTFNCAHCHDHKYDPIAQTDYFRLRAFFEPIYIRQDQLPGQADPGPFQDYDYGKLRTIQRLGMVRVFDKHPDAPTWFYTGGDERNRQTERGPIPPGFPAFLNRSNQFAPQTIPLPVAAFYPALRPEMIAARRSELQQAEQSAREHLTNTPDAATSPATRTALEAATAAFSAAAAAARDSGVPGALSGLQSLHLTASNGRRILQHRLTQLPVLKQGTTLQFQLQLQQNAHVNFQLVKDAVQGLTAGYIAFDSNRIITWAPGSVTDFEAARFDYDSGQRRFEVQLTFDPSADRCLLTVNLLPARTRLVDQLPIALSGWNPATQPNQAVSLDARKGGEALIDDFTILAPGGNPLFSCDFEAPVFTAGIDATGIAGWETSAFSEAGGISTVSSTAANPALLPAWQQLTTAQASLELQRLPHRSAAAALAAAQARSAAWEARLVADRARLAPAASDTSLPQLIAAAANLKLQADRHSADADLLAAELRLVTAQALPPDNADRSKQIDAATAAVATARNAAEKARAAEIAASSAPNDTPTLPPLGPEYPRTSTGRRKALAEWMTDRQHPLTARVAVNYVWLHHFHTPLVATVTDFGRNGASPTHPELLDWLAVELMESGWSLKHLHRLILNSQSWQRRSAVNDPLKLAAAAGSDPENRLLWRMNPGRMEAEVVRDSLLCIAGKLDPAIGGQELENTESLTTFRRSLYYAVYPEQGGRSPLGELFDAPDPLDCYRRTSSIVPQQALALTNSDLVHTVSAAVTAQVAAACSTTASATPSAPAEPDTFIGQAFLIILSRTPTAQELQVCQEFLQQDTPEVARHSLVRALLNHHDFITVH
ncbi:MAG: PSD1 and planctomycete cytochrome C domain-containing protein [Planctomyces sp.]